jgi:hypothetical protein
MTSAYLSSLPHPFFTEAPDGSGSITFGPPPPIWIRGRRGISLRSFASETSTTPVLWYIADVHRVMDLIVQAQQSEPSSFHRPSTAYPVSTHLGGRTETTSSGPVRRGSPLRMLVFAAAAIGLFLVFDGASTLHSAGIDVTNATVMSCVEAPMPYSSVVQYTCDVTWRDDRGQHAAKLNQYGHVPPAGTSPWRCAGAP